MKRNVKLHDIAHNKKIMKQMTVFSLYEDKVYTPRVF